MGMFDCLRCAYPLPMEGANDLDYQTKDTPAQFCDNYEIREDGGLWHEAYDIEDQSNPDAKGIERIFGMCAPVNQRWEPVNFTGEIRFYDFSKDTLEGPGGGWIEWSAYFVKGNLKCLELIEDRK